jgi:hypothetical protein
VAREIVQAAIGGRYSPFDWLGYVSFDPSKVKAPPPEPAAMDVAPEILQSCVGAYKLAADTNVVLHFKVEGGRLYSSSDGQQWSQVIAESETRFFAQGDDTRVEFVKDAAGQVTGLNLEMQGLVLPAKKVR